MINSVFKHILLDFKGYISGERGLSKNTVEAYCRDIERLFASPVLENATSIQDLTKDKIIQHLGELKQKKFASSTVSRALMAIKVFCKFLKREQYLPINISIGLDSPKIWQLVPQVLSIAEVERLLEAPNLRERRGVRDRAILEILYGCGLRVSELCSLNLYDVDDTFVKVKGKGSKERQVPLGVPALKAIDYYLGHYRGECKGDNDPLFVTKRGERIHRRLVWLMIKHYGKKAGIEKNISPHTLRHAYATHLLDNSADLRVIQELMGHAHISSTDRYMHLSKKHIQDKFYACHPRNE